MYFTFVELQSRGYDLAADPHWRSVIRLWSGPRLPRLTYAQSEALILRAIELTGDPDLGLAVGARQKITSFQVLGLAFLASATCHDALRLGLKYHRLTGSMLELDQTVDRNGDMLLVASSRFLQSRILQFLVQELFANVAGVTKFLTQSDRALKAVSLMFPDKQYSKVSVRHFGCPVKFGQSSNCITFNRGMLSKEIDTADSFALAGIIPILDAQLAEEYASQSFLNHVEGIIRRELSRPFSITQLARELAMSERSLRRKLDASATSFREIQDRVRQVRALDLLTRSAMPISLIAEELGFTDPRALRRRLKVWTGTTASQVRRSN